MHKLKIAAAAVAIAAVSGTTWFYRAADGKEAPTYRTSPITRASIRSTVSATGALQAVRTVQVGTQVSGQIAQLYVDFNDKVKKGQLLARIDPTLQQQAVQDAQAQLERANAQLTLAQDEFTRNKALLDARVLSPSEFASTQSNFSVQTATVKSAQIALDRAKQNLSYTSIFAPIDGVIVERNVDVGQTVAASLSAPQLFLIANDLSEMQILASVDESDIGSIKEGQPVQFTVQSYPNDHFGGDVKQVRLQSTTTDNVVNYTAVIQVKNDGGKLLPGMTATVQFVTASATNVLTVPNTALHITPTAAMLAEVGQTSGAGQTSANAAQRPADAAQRTASGQAGQAGQAGQSGQPVQPGQTRAPRTGTRPARAVLWYVSSDKSLHSVPVRQGLSDGQRTEITGEGINEGLQVVTAIGAAGTTAPATAGAATTNPFQPARPQGAGRAPGGR